MDATNVRVQCAVFIATSIDGYIARSDGGLDWLSVVERAGEDYGYREFMDSVDALVMGRNTYDTVQGFGEWPFGGKRVWVLTTRPGEGKHGEEFVRGGVAEVVERLERAGVRRAYVDGGRVIQQWMAAGRVDELTLSVIPVLLGSGVRLFGSDGVEQRMELVGSRAWESGLVQTRYRRVG